MHQRQRKESDGQMTHEEQTIKYLLEKVAYFENTLELSMQNVAHDIVRLTGQHGDTNIALYELKINIERLVSDHISMETEIYLLRNRIEELENKK